MDRCVDQYRSRGWSRALASAVLLGLTLGIPVDTQAQFVDVNLSTWTAERGSWSLASDRLSVKQTVNGWPVFFYSDFEVIGSDMQGKIRVETSGDDDFVGFVLGFEPGDSWSETADYLLIDWKQGNQSYNFGSDYPGGGCTPGTYARRGLALSRVSGKATADELWGHTNFDDPCYGLDSGVEEIARAATRGSTGWSDYAEYTFRFEMTATSLRVFVNGTKEFDVTGSFSNGRLGFYNYSQAQVRYSGFEAEVNNSPIAVDDAFTTDEDTGLTIPLADILVNDSDPDGDAITARIDTPPQHGGYIIFDGNLIYTPNDDFNGTDTIVYSAVDGDGASDSATITITVNPVNDAPTAICKSATINLDADGVATLTPSDVNNGSYDVDGDAIELDLSKETFSAVDLGSQLVVLTVTDPSGEQNQCSALVTVVDEIPPTIDAPGDATFEATGPDGVASADVDLGAAAASDNDSVNPIAIVNDAPAMFPLYPLNTPTVVTWTATDGSGNTSTDTQTVTVVDTTPPVIALDGDDPLYVECDLEVYADPGATASDACDSDVPVIAGGDPVDSNTLGTYVVTYDAVDDSGNAASQVTRTVIVRDMTPPVITLDGANPLYVECNLEPYTDPGATASDACDPDVPVTVGGDTVDPNTLGTYVVTYDAVDDSGNAASQVARTVIVRDMTPPVIALDGDNPLTLELGVDTYAEPGAIASDLCDPGVPVVIGGDEVDSNTLGTYVVIYTASDDSGNEADTVVRTVHVVDTTPPDIQSVAVDSGILWPPNHKMVPVVVTVDALDIADGTNVISEIVEVVSSDPDDGVGDGNAEPDIEITGALTVELRAERSGANVDRVYTITVQCTDLSGNSSLGYVTVTVPHDRGNGGRK